MFENKNLLTLSALVLTAGMQNTLHAEEKTDEACKPDLETRVKKLEDHAVTSDSIKITLSGWVNRALQWADNGFHSNVSTVSPDNVTSNVQVLGTVDVAPDFTMGAKIQMDYASNGTTGNTGGNTFVDVHRSQSNSLAMRNIIIRESEVTADSKHFGKLSLGRGLMASAGVVYYTDLSGTYYFLHPYSSMGGISFRNARNGRPYNENPNSPDATLKPGALVFEHGDGGSIYGRNDRIRYDSPNYYGFNLSTSHSYQNVGDLFDVALKFAAILAKYTIVAQTSWARNHTQDYIQGFNFMQNAAVLGNPNPLVSSNSNLFKGPKFDTFTGAIGVLTPFSFSGKEGTGFNFHFSGASRKWKMANQANGRALQGKIGYLDQYFAAGKTAWVASYGQWRAMDIDFWTNASPLIPGSTGTGRPITMVGTNWGTGVVQNIEAAGTAVYLRYDNYRLKRKGTADRFKPVNIVYSGLMVKL